MFDLKNVKPGEEIQVISLSKDMMDNLCTDNYRITNKNDGYYLLYSKKLSIDSPKDEVYFYGKLLSIGTVNENNEFAENIITINKPLKGKFANGMDFYYNKIIAILKNGEMI